VIVSHGHGTTIAGRAGESATKTGAAPAPDVTWRELAGVRLPFSRLHGPRIINSGQAAGYSRSEQGAAFAAVQVLARTSATVGPLIYEPILATQVTGVNLPAMKLAITDEYERRRAASGVDEGAPVPVPGTSIIGYVMAAYGPQSDSATVDVVITSTSLQPSGQSIAFHVGLLWQGDDWKVIAPPNGDWGSVATALGAPPPGLIQYGG
jgi:hypothetical protein